MTAEPQELSPLAPSAAETAMGAGSVASIALLIGVVVLVIWAKVRVPYGLLGYAVLFLLPLVGPLLILSWNWRFRRFAARRDQLSAA